MGGNPSPPDYELADRLARSGDTVYGFAVGVYPTHHPTAAEQRGLEDARIAALPSAGR